MGITMPDSGRVSLFGKPFERASLERVGYLPEERGLYKKMKVHEQLVFFGELHGLSAAEAGKRATDWAKKLEIDEALPKKTEELSKGMQQKIQFISAVIHRPDLLILDEPFSGLDPMNQRLLRDLVLEEHRRGATILFSTHVMIHAEQLCDHIVMIHKGRKVLDDPMSGLRRQFDTSRILFEPLNENADLAVLQKIPGVEQVSTQNDAAIEREFDMLMAKAGAKIPTDRKAGIVAGYKDMKRMTALLRQPRTAADEPSNIYNLTGFLRSKS